MCGRDGSETSDDDQQPRSILGRLADRWPRTAAATSACCWLGAITALILHAHHITIRSETAFGLDDAWLIGAGSIGVPVLALNILGPRLSVRSLELIAAFCFAAAAIVTVFVAAGQSHMGTWTAIFICIMPLAMGIQAFNGAYGLDKRAAIARRIRAEEREKAALALAEAKKERDAAVEDAYLLGLAKAFGVQHARAAEVSNVLKADTEDLSAACALLQEELVGRQARRVVNGQNGHNGHHRSAKVLRLVTGKQDPHTQTGADPD